GAESELRFGHHRQRLPLTVVVEPRLAREEALRPVVAARAQLGLRALDDERGVGSRLARRRREQALRRMPRAARRAQRPGRLAQRDVHFPTISQPAGLAGLLEPLVRRLDAPEILVERLVLRRDGYGVRRLEEFAPDGGSLLGARLAQLGHPVLALEVAQQA